VAGEAQRLAGPWWYEDPARRHDLRYWTGTQWSEFVIDGPNRTPSIDPPTVRGPTASGVTSSTDGAGATPDIASTPAGVAEADADADAEGRRPSRKLRIVLLALLVTLVGALLGYAVLGRGGDDRVGAAPSAPTATSSTWDAAAPALWQQAEAGALIAEKGRVDVINGSATGDAALSNVGAGECDQGEAQLKQARASLLPVPQPSALSDRDALELESLLNGWVRVAHQCDAASEFTGGAEAARLEAALARL
jgi:hypothetical protein